MILAGGEGTRLRPYTTVLPKPLLPVGNQPIAEIIVRQLRHYGCTRITFAVGYLSQLLEAYFGDGSHWDVQIDYLREEQPLGTVGPLARLDNFNEPLLVMNGDILTDLDYRAFYRSHLDAAAKLSIATFSKMVKVDLGVLETDSTGHLTAYHEKPEHNFQVSMGIYVFSPSVPALIPQAQRFDLPDLVGLLLDQQQIVQSYPFSGHWLDIGRDEDFQRATDFLAEHRESFLPFAMAGPQHYSQPPTITEGAG
ncbi:MAG: sugar phosphate nucleotidyltransferase [bacterium]